MAQTPQAIQALKAKRLEIVRTASEAIPIFSPVSMVDKDNCEIADVSSEATATVIGVTLNAALIGENVTILLYGAIEDASFTFALNIGLFQSSAGPISATATTTVGEWFCRIGKSLGTGAILVAPEPPIEVT